jgi:sugar lactone lactonase YvrE
MIGAMNQRRLLALILPLSILALIPGSATAAPHLDEVADLSGPPGQMTYGPDGNAWVLFNGAGNETLARVKPSGKVKEYEVPDLNGAVGITRGPNRTLWASRNGGVVKVPVNDPENSEDFAIAALGGGQGIVNGPQNRIYAVNGDKFVSFSPNNPAGFEEDTITGMDARGIDEADGKLWVADFGGSDIVRVNPNGNDFKRFNVGGGPQQVSDGPNGQVAYANPGSDPQTVGRIKGNDVDKTNDPGADPFGIEFAGDGNWWIGQFNKQGLGVLRPDGKLKQFKDLPQNSKTRYLATGGAIVFAGIENRDKVAVIKGVN